MAIYTAVAAQDFIQPSFMKAGMISMSSKWSPSPLPAVVGDIFKMVKVPAGFQVQDVILNVISSAGVGSVVLGDSLDTNRFASASIGIVARLGKGLVANDLIFPFTYTEVDTINVVVAVLPASQLLTIGLTVVGSMDYVQPYK